MEDTDPCPVPLIYKWANTSPPELGFLSTKEDTQNCIVPKVLKCLLQVTSLAALPAGLYGKLIIPSPVAEKHLLRSMRDVLPRRAFFFLLGYRGSQHALDVSCIQHLYTAFVGQDK